MGQADEPGLGRGIMRTDDAARLCRDGGKIDDASPAALAHAGENALGDEEGGLEIDVKKVVPIGFRQVAERLDLGDPGVVDEDVHGAKVALDGDDEAVDISRDGNVGLDRDGSGSKLLNR